MMSDGTPWPPLVHVEDICQAIILALKATRDAIYNQIFNVGNDDQNYQICEIATVGGCVFENCTLTFWPNCSGDKRETGPPSARSIFSTGVSLPMVGRVWSAAANCS